MALRAKGEMEAAMALMQMSSDPPALSSKPELASVQSAQTKATPVTTESCETQTDFTYEVPVVPSTSNRSPTRVSLDVTVKVTAGHSNHQSYGAGPSNSFAPKFEKLPNGDLINWKNNTRKYEEFPALPEENLTVNNRGSWVKTRDVGTQTDYYDDPCQRLLERVVMLRARKKELEGQLKYIQENTPPRTDNSNSDGDSYTPSGSGSAISKYTGRTSRGSTSSNNTRQSFDSDEDVEFKSEDQEIFDIDDDDDEEDFPNTAKSNSNVTMVPIGYGKAKVPLSLIKHMDWTSYSYATRKLLTAVFPRKVLATHSLSGKPSPAFPGKKAKTQLDPDLVNDIVRTVMEKCDISEGRIRTSITTKCADESKMFRNRMKNKIKRRLLAKKENLYPRPLPPPPPYSAPSDILLPLNLSIKND